jgi:hypothetical protein
MACPLPSRAERSAFGRHLRLTVVRLVGQTIAFRGLSRFAKVQPPDRVEKPRPCGRLASVPHFRHRFFMKFRGPKALGDRRQKTVVCPTSHPT